MRFYRCSFILAFAFYFFLNDLYGTAYATLQLDNQLPTASTSQDTLRFTQSNRPDSTSMSLEDSLASDRFFSHSPKSSHILMPFEKKLHVFFVREEGVLTTRKVLSEDGHKIEISEFLGDMELRRIELTWDEYSQLSYERTKRENFLSIINEDYDAIVKSDINSILRDAFTKFRIGVYIPALDNTLFQTIFGPPLIDVAFRTNINVTAGVKLFSTSNPSETLNDRSTTVAPDFSQKFDANLSAKIGTKLTISADYSTQRTFSTENQIRAKYEGYDDDIVKLIEVGTVNFSSVPSLIGGGQGLFGIKGELQLGPLSLSMLASRQQAKTNRKEIEGKSEERVFQLKPYDYEENKHFFITNYAITQWDKVIGSLVLSQTIPNIVVIHRLEVWILRSQANNLAKTRRAVALLNYGDQPYDQSIVDNGGAFPPPMNLITEPGVSQENTQDLLHQYRTIPDADLSDKVAGEFKSGSFELLTPQQDYEIDQSRGFISFKTPISSQDVVAVSYECTIEGQTIQVGDFSHGSYDSSDRLILKLIKGGNISPTLNPGQWALMLKNVYDLQSTLLSKDDISVDIVYRSTIDQKTSGTNEIPFLPLADGRKENLLMEVTGLDRFDDNGNPVPNQKFDFFSGITINPTTGKLIFPYLRPFYDPIKNLSSDPKDEVLAYQEVYQSTKQQAMRESVKDKYTMIVKVRGEVRNPIQLSPFVVQKSVRITYDGILLEEDKDYSVDYHFGSVTIDRQYLIGGGKLRIEYDENDLIQQNKELWGFRSELLPFEQLKLGATFLQYIQRNQYTKSRVGEEAILNSIYGFDGTFRVDLPWINEGVNLIPFIKARQESHFEVKGEFAHVLPGILPEQRNEYSDPDGVSYIDDFDNTARISPIASSPDLWFLAPPPSEKSISILQEDVALSETRALLNWFRLPLDDTRNPLSDEFFPTRNVSRDRRLPVFFLDYYPAKRGPYNFSVSFFSSHRSQSPRNSWGGIIRAFPEGFEDLEKQQFEFIQCWIKVESIDDDGSLLESETLEEGFLYLDLGVISEDVIPNGVLNTEDGAPLSDQEAESTSAFAEDQYSRYPTNISRIDRNLSEGEGGVRVEDVGLDGLSDLEEQNKHADYLSAIKPFLSEEYYRRISIDPAGDNIGITLDRRKIPSVVNGSENSSGVKLTRNQIAFYSNRYPDTEDLDGNVSLDRKNSFYRYKLPLSSKPFQKNGGTSMHPFFQGVKKLSSGTWIQVKIPLSSYDRKVGNVSDFRNIKSARLWASGFSRAVRLSIMSLEFSGSEWVKFPLEDTKTIIDGVSVEENGDIYVSPPGIRQEQIFLPTGDLYNQNERSIVIAGVDVQPGEQRVIERSFGKDLNLNRYRRIRAYLRASKEKVSYNGNRADTASNTMFFIRFGLDNSENYFEYRTTIIPTPLEPKMASTLWSTENNIDIDIQEFTSMKLVVSSRKRFNTGDLEIQKRGDGKYYVMKGNPSISSVRVIVMGLIQPTMAESLKRIEVWVNELRVSGYLREGGYSWEASARLAIADIATVSGSIKQATSNFHSIYVYNNALEFQSERLNWVIGTNLDLGRFIPSNIGAWKIPISYTHTEEHAQQKYAPAQPDVLLSISIDKLVEDSLANGGSQEEVEKYRQDLLNEANSTVFRDNLQVALSKTRSDFWFWNYTLDAIRLVFNWSQGFSSSPSQEFNNTRKWNLEGHYKIQIPPLNFRPFQFLKKVPFLSVYKDLSILPTSVSMAWSLAFDRQWDYAKSRNVDAPKLPNSSLNTKRTFSFSFSLLDNVQFSYTSTLVSSLNHLLYQKEGVPIPEENIYSRILDKISNFSFGIDQNMSQNVTISWAPYITRLPVFFWLTPLKFSYRTSYVWTNPQVDVEPSLFTGSRSTVSTNLNVSTGIEVKKIVAGILEIFGDKDNRGYNAMPFSNMASIVEDTTVMPLKIVTYSLGELIKAITRFDRVAVTYLRGISMNHNGLSSGPGYLNFFPFHFLHPDASHMPSLAYQLGLDTNPGARGMFVAATQEEKSLEFSNIVTESHNINLATAWTPFSFFRVSFEWKTKWSNNLTHRFLSSTNENSYYQRDISIERTFLSIGRTIDDFEVLFRKNQEEESDVSEGERITDAFIDGFLTSSLGLDGIANISREMAWYFPLPNWRITVSGIHRLPYFKDVLSVFSMSHAYQSKSSIAYSIRKDTLLPTSSSIQENFQPLIKVDMNWKFGLQSAISYSFLRSFDVNYSNRRSINEKNTISINLNLGYSITGLEIPINIWFLKGITLKNTLGLKAGFTLSETISRTYTFEKGKARRVTNEVGQTNYSIDINISYALDSIKVNAFWKYTKTVPATPSVTIYSTEEHHFGISAVLTLGT